MTEERKQELASQRQAQLEKDHNLAELGQLVDGVQMIKKALTNKPVEDLEPQLVLAGGKGGKFAGKAAAGRRVSVKR